MDEQSLSTYLANLADGSATPGGGSVAALNGAMAAALVCMVCNLSLKSERASSARQVLTATLQAAERLQDRLTRLSREDSLAFDQVIEAYRLPKQSETENRSRKRALEDAYQTATLVPLHTAQSCAGVIALAEELLNYSKPSAAGDAVAAGVSALAGLKIAVLNIAINLRFINDDAFKSSIKSQLEALGSNHENRVQRLVHRASEQT